MVLAHVVEAKIMPPPPPDDHDEFMRRQIAKYGRGSMAPNLEWSDRFLVHKRMGWGRWSIVEYHPPDAPSQEYAGRIVGMPGETIELVGDELRINSLPMTLPRAVGPFSTRAANGRLHGPGCEDNRITLKSDEFYILGDNPAIANDARFWDGSFPGHQRGAMPGDQIIGRVTYIYWPPSRWRKF